MPLWYASMKNEHLAVLTHAGLFDSGHMALVAVKGRQALDLLQFCFTADLDGCIGPAKKPLSAGRCVYGAFLDPKGCVLDDAIVYHLAGDDYLVVVNAAMGPVIANHLSSQAGDRQVSIHDLTDGVAKIDIQGSAAVSIMSLVLKHPEAVFSQMPYFAFKGHFDSHGPGADDVVMHNGAHVLISRTGYTGEVGFEIFCRPQDARSVWDTLLQAGSAKGLQPCGLAARDSLRAGAVLPLSHQDIGPWPFVKHPWTFALPYKADGKTFTKSFLGAGALQEMMPVAEHTHAFAGYNPRKVSVVEQTVVMDTDNNVIGHVLTCVTDMGIDRREGRIFSVASPDKPEEMKFRGLCCGFLKVKGPLSLGQQVQLKNSRRTITVEIVNNIRPHRTARIPLTQFL